MKINSMAMWEASLTLAIVTMKRSSNVKIVFIDDETKFCKLNNRLMMRIWLQEK